MIIFLGIAIMGVVGLVVCKTIKASKQPVNGELGKLRGIGDRIETVGHLLSNYTHRI